VECQFQRDNTIYESRASVLDIPALPETTTKPANRRVNDE